MFLHEYFKPKTVITNGIIILLLSPLTSNCINLMGISSAHFGLYHINFTDPNRTRTAKKSVSFYKEVIAKRQLNETATTTSVTVSTSTNPTTESDTREEPTTTGSPTNTPSSEPTTPGSANRIFSYNMLILIPCLTFVFTKFI